jgi:hypothetical protein
MHDTCHITITFAVPQIQAVLRKHLDRIDEWLKGMGDKLTTKRKWEVLEDRLMAMSRRIEPKGAPRSAIA